VEYQGIGVYFLIPETCQEIQEFHHFPIISRGKVDHTNNTNRYMILPYVRDGLRGSWSFFLQEMMVLGII
jgi:hypothetical protein